MTSQATSKGYMLDTNVFNDVVDNKIAVEEFANLRICATHVQLDEFKKSKPERAAALMDTFDRIAPSPIVTSSAMWDVSKLDNASWPPEDGLSGKNAEAALRA